MIWKLFKEKLLHVHGKCLYLNEKDKCMHNYNNRLCYKFFIFNENMKNCGLNFFKKKKFGQIGEIPLKKNIGSKQWM